jgi:hypothetical protein
MRRFSLIVGFGLLGAASLTFAQRGQIGFETRANVGLGVSSGFSRPGGGLPIYPTPLGLQRQYSGFTGILPGAIPNGRLHGGRGFGGFKDDRHRDRGFVGFGNAPIAPYFSYWPFFDSDYGYASPNESYAQDQAAQTELMNQNALGEQVDRLTAEVEQLRDEQRASHMVPMPYGALPPYAGVPYAPNGAPAMQPTEPQSAQENLPIILVLKDGKQVTLKSYAVMGGQVWDFTAHPVKKYPLGTIDLDKSRAATEAAGADFPNLPKAKS